MYHVKITGNSGAKVDTTVDTVDDIINEFSQGRDNPNYYYQFETRVDQDDNGSMVVTIVAKRKPADKAGDYVAFEFLIIKHLPQQSGANAL